MAETKQDMAEKEVIQKTVPKLELLSNQGLKDFYNDIRKQLRQLFLINIIICITAFIAIVVGVILLFLSRIEAGVVTIVSSVLSEAAVLLFTKQYERIFALTTDKFSELVLYDNMAILINCILELPEKDGKGESFSSLEFRENVRPIMKAYAKKIGLNIET